MYSMYRDVETGWCGHVNKPDVSEITGINRDHDIL